jgi:signal transduction histidine kinase
VSSESLQWNDSNGKIIVTNIIEKSNADNAGVKKGDILLSVQNRNLKDLSFWTTINDFKPGSIVNYKIERNGNIIDIPVKLNSMWRTEGLFYCWYYLLIGVVIFIGLFVLYLKPLDKTTHLFFVFSQIFAICLNSDIFMGDKFGFVRTVIFSASFPFLGTILLHFFLSFPRRSVLLTRNRVIITFIYAISVIVSLFLIYEVSRFNYSESFAIGMFKLSLQIAVLWMGITLLAAILISVYNFFTIKEINVHNQLRWVMLGVLFGLLPETIFGLFPQFFWNLAQNFPHILDVIWALGTIILLLCLAYAIIRYRLWDIEIIIKKSILYTSLTATLIGGYFLLFWLTEQFLKDNSGTSQLVSLIFTAGLLIPSHEFLQKRIDKLFHREHYDPTSSALKFEHSLIGEYDFNTLVIKICRQIDLIFNFYSFSFLLKNNTNVFVNAYSLGTLKIDDEFSFISSNELDEKLTKNKTLAVEELDNYPEQFKKCGAELITPVIFENILFGCFVCGRKLSNRNYTKQDIDMLNLLANRTATILQMSILYKNELERQTLIEKERLRISKDMHDEVGSSLTKIAVLGELVQREINNKDKIEPSIKKITSISREVIDNISEIIWAINPKNDKLENLASYLHEYVSDFLEGTGISASFESIENFPSIELSAELRRNIFLVMKEIVNNAVKHSHASNFNLKLDFCEGKFLLSLSDNGTGFSSEQKSKFGNGLTNMKKRIEDIGGIISIESSASTGTMIQIEVAI